MEKEENHVVEDEDEFVLKNAEIVYMKTLVDSWYLGWEEIHI